MRVLVQSVPRRYSLSNYCRPQSSTEIVSRLIPTKFIEGTALDQSVPRRYSLSYYCRPQSSTEVVSRLIPTKYIEGTGEF